MTTNVRDSISHVLAADSRWSVDLTRYGVQKIIFIDENSYQKLIQIGSGLFMFAGDGKLIDSWKFAIGLANQFPNAVNWSNMPTTGLAVCAVDRLSGNVMFDMNHSINDKSVSFAGSGASFAAKCWKINRNAILAVNTAKESDVFSGGEVKYYQVSDGQNNIGLDGPLSGLNKVLGEKGFVMDVNLNSTAQPISEAAQNDPFIRSIASEIAKGNINATAPHEHMNKVWTEDEKKELFTAMEFFFPKSA